MVQAFNNTGETTDAVYNTSDLQGPKTIEKLKANLESN